MNNIINESKSFFKKNFYTIVQVVSHIFCFLFPSVGFYIFESYLIEEIDPLHALIYTSFFYILMITICIAKNFKCARVLTASFLTIPVTWVILYMSENDEKLYEYILALTILAVITSLIILIALMLKNSNEINKLFTFFIKLSSIIVIFSITFFLFRYKFFNLGFANKVTIVSYVDNVEKRLEVKNLSELRRLVIHYSGKELNLKRFNGLNIKEESTYFIFESSNRIVEVHYGCEVNEHEKLNRLLEYCRYYENGKTIYINPYVNKYDY